MRHRQQSELQNNEWSNPAGSVCAGCDCALWRARILIDTSKFDWSTLYFRALSSSPWLDNTGQFHTHMPIHTDTALMIRQPILHSLLSTLLPGNRSFQPMRSSPPLSYHHTRAGRPLTYGPHVFLCVWFFCTLLLMLEKTSTHSDSNQTPGVCAG